MKVIRRSSASRVPWRLASPSRATHSVAVANATRWPARQALIDRAIARWLLPVPGGPKSTTFSLACRKSISRSKVERSALARSAQRVDGANDRRDAATLHAGRLTARRPWRHLVPHTLAHLGEAEHLV